MKFALSIIHAEKLNPPPPKRKQQTNKMKNTNNKKYFVVGYFEHMKINRKIKPTKSF